MVGTIVLKQIIFDQQTITQSIIDLARRCKREDPVLCLELLDLADKLREEIERLIKLEAEHDNQN